MISNKVAIVIPALNEQKTILKVISGAKDYGTIIVVDDGSKDLTSKISISAGAIVVTHKYNLGYDSALYSGFCKAKELNKEFIISIDADGQHSTKDLENIIKPLIEGKSNFSIGDRGKSARLSEFIFCFIANKFFGINDILCGLKGFHIDLFNKFGWIMEKETIGTGLALIAAKAGFIPTQININIKTRDDNPRIGRIMRANWIIFKGMFSALKNVIFS